MSKIDDYRDAKAAASAVQAVKDGVDGKIVAVEVVSQGTNTGTGLASIGFKFLPTDKQQVVTMHLGDCLLAAVRKNLPAILTDMAAASAGVREEAKTAAVAEANEVLQETAK